ncbi:MAG: hypothetical protein RQ743_01665 [Bacteroidales bacterium]|nr:hypothetical protein [Bacteroidales bacterium]
MKWVAGVILIIVLIIALFLIGRHVPFGAGNSVFNLENAEGVTSISIVSDNSSVNLERRTDKWYVNGKEPARQAAVESLLKIIRDIRIKSPVSSDVFNDILRDGDTQRTDIKIYDDRRIVQSFHIYSNPSYEVPCIMRKRDDAKPFFVHVPAYDLDPGTFFIADQRFWMPNTLFSTSPGMIKEIHFEYFETPDSSFSISINGSQVSFRSEIYVNETIDTTAVGRYLSYFTYVPFESRVLDMTRAAMDSIRQDPPYFKLELIGRGADTTSLLTWTRIFKGGSKNLKDTDRLWGSINGEDLLIFRYYDLDPLIKGPSYFISD